jgi:integrase
LDNAGCFFDFYVFALATGLRACDMWDLDVNSFETDKDGNMFLKGFSNKTGENISIPLNEDAVKVVNRANGKLFPNANEELWRKALRRNLINNFDYAYARKHNIRLHTFRHTFAVSALKAGMPKEAIQSYLGHSSIQTTEIYCKQMSKTQLLQYTDLIKVTS